MLNISTRSTAKVVEVKRLNVNTMKVLHVQSFAASMTQFKLRVQVHYYNTLWAGYV